MTCNKVMWTAAAVISALTVLAPVAGHAKSAGYEITLMEDKGDFVGCLATDAVTSIGILGIGEHVMVMFSSNEFHDVAVGQKALGTWSVDGSKAVPFVDDKTGKNTVTAELTGGDQLAKLKAGNIVTVSVANEEVEFDLAGFTKGFKDLAQCMQTKKAP